MTLNPRAALFDLDDTLIGRDTAFELTARELYDSQPAINQDISWGEAYEFALSLSPHGTIDAQAAALQLNARWPALNFDPVEFEIWFFETLASHARPLPGVIDMLHELNDATYPWGVVTNGKKFQLIKLHEAGLIEIVPFAIVSRLFGADKPDPSIYEAGLHRLKASFEGIDDIAMSDVLFIGDNPYTDITGAMHVGMRTAWVHTDYDYPNELKIPDMTIDSVVQLRPTLGLST